MMFMDFTKRYNDWISSIPLDLNDGNGSSGNHRTKNHVRMYFDLCSEEYYMYRKGLIEDVVWKYWTEGMRDAFKIYKLGNFWQGELGQYYNEGFKHFVTNEVLRNNAPH